MRISKALFLVPILFILFGCSHSNTYGPYFGKVIDIETKEPIEGAAVLVVFYTNEPGPAGSITRYADAVETVTDKNGEFRMPAHRVTSTRFLYLLENYGHFTIFKPGYGCYPMHKGVRPMFVPNGTLPPRQYVTIELPRLRTKDERLENQRCEPILIPKEKYKRFLIILNDERKSLGLESEPLQ